MNYLKHILILLYFLSGNGFLGSANTIYDVFENKLYEINTHFKEVNINNSYLKNEIDISYLNFKEPSDKVQKVFNEKSFEWVRDYVNSEKKYYSLLSEIKQKMKVYNELTASKNSYDYGYEDVLTMNSVRLIEVECAPYSVVNNKLFFELQFVFEFGASNRGYNSENKIIKITEVFIADMSSGTISPFEIDLNPEKKRTLMDELSEVINEQYLLIKSQLDVEILADIKSIDENLVNCKNVCELIDLEDANVYWLGWGVMLSFQDLSPSSKIYYGQGFNVFLPLQRNSETIQFFDEFKFAKQLKIPPVNIQDFEFNNYHKKRTISTRNEPDIRDLLRLNNVQVSPRLLEKTHFQVQNDSIKRFLSKKEYRFNKNRRITSEKTFDEEGNIGFTLKIEYNRSGNIKLKSSTKGNGEEKTYRYSYDDNGNNIKELLLNEFNYRERYFFYNGNHVYYFDNKMFNTYSSGLDINELFISEEKYCTKRGCFKFDEKGMLMGFFGVRGYDNIQIGRDDQGRISDIHSDNDRYLTLYKYDTLNRLSSFEVYDEMNQISKSVYKYKSENLLPSGKTTTNRNAVTEEKYEWR
ncbi:MAG: hypothetical protein ACQERC_08985 [Bacteroidota bacterium]